MNSINALLQLSENHGMNSIFRKSQGANHLIDALETNASANPDRIFVQFPDGTELSFGSFFEGARKCAEVFANVGVCDGARVALQVEKSIQALQVYLGAVMAGGVLLPLNPAYTTSEILYFLTDASPVVFICDPSRMDELSPVAKAAGVATVLNLDAAGLGSFRELIDLASGNFSPLERHPEDLAAILYTSGTTGRSKGAMLSHRALVSNSQTLCDIWQFTDQDILIHALPIFHTHGLFVATNVALMSGASIRFLPKFDPELVLNAMPTSTVLMGVPTFYTRLLDCDRLDKNLAGNMRLFISGSAPLLSETHKRWRECTGHQILERYGMTETNMNTSNPYGGERRAGTVGFALPGVELRICDPESGNPLEQGEIGIIEVRGPNVFSGYWNMPEKTAEDLRKNGFLITGDQGFVDGDGYVHIIGRSKDMVITGGFNVYPKEVESLLDKIKGIIETAVIGVPHPDFGEAVVAVVVLDGSVEINGDEISGFLSDKLASYKRPKSIKFLEVLPRNTMGKVQKMALRDTYQNEFLDH